MTANEILEGNILIAKFMGNQFLLDKLGDGEAVDIRIGLDWENYCKFHNSWDWLMPVVEKIESLFEGNVYVGIQWNICHIDVTTQYTLAHDINFLGIEYHKEPTKIEAVWLAVIEFVKWYNYWYNYKEEEGWL